VLMTTTDPMSCETCGQPHVRCSGHTKTDPPRPCQQPPMTGQRVCRKHGGKAPQNLAAAARRIDQAEKLQALHAGLAAAYGDHVPDVDLGEAMLRAVAWKYAEVLALRALVAALDDGERVWGVVRDKSGGEDYGVTREARPSVWWVMLREAERDLVKFAGAARAAGVAEQRIQLEHDKARAVAVALQEGMDAAGLTSEQRLAFSQAFLVRMRTLEGAVPGAVEA
jgi:hypothetical protein